MTQTASQELSAEFYDLSKWVDPRANGSSHVPGAPFYFAGYLLRKLPQYTKLFRNNLGHYYAAAVTGGFRHPDNRFGQPDSADDWYIAKTPEDALCKLAIELFKAGVLS